MELFTGVDPIPTICSGYAGQLFFANTPQQLNVIHLNVQFLFF
jgi:hypothetical protein